MDLALLPYLISAMALIVSAIVVWRRGSNGNGHVTQQAREIASAASDVADSSAALVESMRAYVTVLQQQIINRGDAPVPATQAESLAAIAHGVAQHYTDDEIHALAFELGLDAEVNGDSRSAKALSLVVAAKNRYMTYHLLERLRKERPQVHWPNP